jgi:hypothetical protein
MRVVADEPRPGWVTAFVCATGRTMDPRETILAELELSQRIVGDLHEVVPRFSIRAPDGTHTVIVQLTHDLADRIKRMQVVRSFMIWKAAHGFILASELVEPDAISVVAVTRADAIGALQRIHRKPLSFDAPEWFGREKIGEEIASLLPPRELAITAEESAFMRWAFEEGQCPGITWRRRGDED